MADALTRLVQRTLHPSASVQVRPRPSYDFGAGPAAGGPTSASPTVWSPAARQPAATHDDASQSHDSRDPSSERHTANAPVADGGRAAAAAVAHPTVRAVPAMPAGDPAVAAAHPSPSGSSGAQPVTSVDRALPAAPHAPAAPSAARPRPASSSEPSARRRAAPEQLVQITIGRIEVRAGVAPVTTHASPEPARRVMPLDEYLARRAGERGR